MVRAFPKALQRHKLIEQEADLFQELALAFWNTIVCENES